MRKMSYILSALALIGLPAYADNTHDHMAGMVMGATKAQAETHKGQGTVNKLDVLAGSVNLTHDPIKSLGWSGMTMDFKVKNKTTLDKIKPGTKVDFEVTKEADGTFFITRITPAK